MNLIIDIGNTLTKIASFKEDQMEDLWTGPFVHAPKTIADLIQANTFEAAIVSTVQHKQGDVPEELRFLKKEDIWVITARHGMPLPITIHYNTPETLGTDRIASAVAGHHFSPDEAVLVINAGTCLTTDLVTAKGEYLGGTISPGLQMRFNALSHYTANLPLIHHQKYSTLAHQPSNFNQKTSNPKPQTSNNKFQTPDIKLLTSDPKHQTSNIKPQTSNNKHQAPNLLPGKSTHDAIFLGVTTGMAGEIDGLIEGYRKKISFFNVILSGGDIKIFDKKLKNRIFAIENIVLHGLNQMLIHNAQTFI